MENIHTHELDQLADNISNLKLSFQKFNKDDYLNSIKMDAVAKYLTEHRKNPKATKKEICLKIEISPSLLNKYLKQLGMEKLIRPKKSVKKSNTEAVINVKSKKKKLTGGGLSKDVDEEEMRDKINNAFK